MREFHTLIYPTFNFNTNLSYSVLTLMKTIKGFTIQIGIVGNSLWFVKSLLGKRAPWKRWYPTVTAWAVWKLPSKPYPLLEASEAWSGDCVWYLYSADYLYIHFLTEDLKLQFNKIEPVGEESWNTHLDTRHKIAPERPTKNWEALAVPKGGDPMVRKQWQQGGMKTLVFYE